MQRRDIHNGSYCAEAAESLHNLQALLPVDSGMDEAECGVTLGAAVHFRLHSSLISLTHPEEQTDTTGYASLT